jgi:mediator of RNA polymerase II transcription subunit 12, fungi type
MGVQPRPPQRSLSGSGLAVQRPPHQRTLSQQYLPPSPIRKETFSDLTPEGGGGGDSSQSRYGATPRRGGSRLKLELSNDSMLAQPSVSDSPQTLTPARIMPHEISDLSEMSPRPLGTVQQGGDSDNAPMPMPKRRPRYVLPKPRRDTRPAAPAPATSRRDPRPKPYALDVPAAAPKYPPPIKVEPMGKPNAKGGDGSEGPKVGHADFFPWTGEHPEDHFSETVIRNGFFDKAPMAQTETTSAKSALFPALKHKSGMSALSTIFIGILNQRRHGGQVTAPSTFKPPPRVTLTDTKRELWLKDLANPGITLRRLSRTIPHGIRGKGLLEQCMNKNVPTDRAVWLARCVGANEIRATKRKGVSGTILVGEAAWVREWTLNVERFVETVMLAFGEADWKAKVTYA